MIKKLASSPQSLDRRGGDVAAGPDGQPGPVPARGSRRRGWLMRRFLLAADLLALSLAFLVVDLLYVPSPTQRVAIEALVTIACLPAWVLAAKASGLYDRDDERTRHSTADELLEIAQLVTVGVWGFFALSWVTGLSHPRPPKLLTFWLLAIAAIVVFRTIARGIARRATAYVQNAVIVGAGDIGQLIGRKLVQHPEYGIRLVGFIDSDPKGWRGDLGSARLLGGPGELREVIPRYSIERVIIAFSSERHQEQLELLRAIREFDVQVDVVPRLFEAFSPQAELHTVEGLPLIGLPPMRMPRSSRFVKRCIDLAGASIGLILVAPVMGMSAILIKLGSPGPILFRQTRLGANQRKFTALKFRTMAVDTDESPHREYMRQIMDSRVEPTETSLYKLSRVDAVTRVGRILRATSLDELPQLINIVRGDMSLVGPRPCIPYELEFFEPQHFERFLVPAGLTGLWQVEARARSTFKEALDLDVAYVHGWSIGLDLSLLVRTPWGLFRPQGTG
jgi:exopolysaccharide biosynthesis polyprenyl glycosylphosphotransferase